MVQVILDDSYTFKSTADSIKLEVVQPVTARTSASITTLARGTKATAKISLSGTSGCKNALNHALSVGIFRSFFKKRRSDWSLCCYNCDDLL